ncbi:MAG: hypothetical protein ACYS5F_12210 [Planctomycetota bacterium]|jgi:hypothetical protein
MAVYSKPSSAVGLYFARKIAVALSLPLESGLLELVLTFPFNVLLVMTVVLIVWIVRIFTGKPPHINHSMVDVESQPAQEAEKEMSILARGTILKGPMLVEEMPRNFKGSKEGVVKLYIWFYRFAQGRLGGIADNMTPREFMSVVSGRIPSQGVIPLEYLVTSFEIAKYSKIKPTKEMQSKCLDSVEVLKDLIECGDTRMSDDVNELNEPSLELITHNVQVHEV